MGNLLCCPASEEGGSRSKMKGSGKRESTNKAGASIVGKKSRKGIVELHQEEQGFAESDSDSKDPNFMIPGGLQVEPEMNVVPMEDKNTKIRYRFEDFVKHRVNSAYQRQLERELMELFT
jgi:hypothetical protein